MHLDQKLVDAAIAFVKARAREQEAGAAAMYTEDGEILVSMSPATMNSSTTLCHEVGAICEAYNKDKKIAATVCVNRNVEGGFIILAPCGICQERLMSYGEQVECAVAKDGDPTQWVMKRLGELQPYSWRHAVE